MVLSLYMESLSVQLLTKYGHMDLRSICATSLLISRIRGHKYKALTCKEEKSGKSALYCCSQFECALEEEEGDCIFVEAHP